MNKQTTKQILIFSSLLRAKHKEFMKEETKNEFNNFYFKEWISFDSLIKFLESKKPYLDNMDILIEEVNKK